MDIAAVSDGIRLLALRPGDRLGIMLPEVMEEEEIQVMRDRLKAVWPEIVPAFFAGDLELVVVRSEES